MYTRVSSYLLVCLCKSILLIPVIDEMIQCDSCHYWQHCSCVGKDGIGMVEEEYNCEFCTTGNLELLKEVVMSPQPVPSLGLSVYYRTLVKDGFQIRVGKN